jgi:hypothetical protein
MAVHALKDLQFHSPEHLSKFKAQAPVKESVITFFHSRFPRGSIQGSIVFVICPLAFDLLLGSR